MSTIIASIATGTSYFDTDTGEWVDTPGAPSENQPPGEELFPSEIE
jgi:hypothetical protein